MERAKIRSTKRLLHFLKGFFSSKIQSLSLSNQTKSQAYLLLYQSMDTKASLIPTKIREF